MSNFDLHIHSSYSDGSDNLKELLQNIQAAGITTFALTDHDTIEGCKEMQKLITPGIKFIPSVELTCIAGDIKCHILGYGCEPENSTLCRLIEYGKLLRRQKLETRIEYLYKNWNITLTQEELDWLYSRRSVVKTHFANILVKRGLANDNVSAMQKYLDGCKTGNTRFDAIDAIKAIKESGGIPIWAHPLGGEGERHLSASEFYLRLKKMLNYEIEGLECYYSRYNKTEAEFLASCASHNELLISAGSDYHGRNKTGIKLGQLSSDKSVPQKKDITILNVL